MTDHQSSTCSEDLFAPLRSLDTGDILLYRTKDIGATFNAVMQGSLYSHISVVVCGDPLKLNEMYPDDYKEDPPTSQLAILEAVPTRGVALFPLEARLTRSIGLIQKLVARRHVGIITDKARASLDDFMEEVMGRNLEIATADMLRSLFYNRLRGKYGIEGNEERNWDEFFCSELVGEALQHLGIIRERGLMSNNLIPASFEERKICSKDPNRTLHFAEHIEMPNHHYGPEEVLLKSGCPLKVEMKRRKKLMKDLMKESRKQKRFNEKHSQKDRHSNDSDHSESSSGEQPWWQLATLDSLKQNMSDLRIATDKQMADLKEKTSQTMLQAEKSVNKHLRSVSPKREHSQRTLDTSTSVNESN